MSRRRSQVSRDLKLAVLSLVALASSAACLADDRPLTSPSPVGAQAITADINVLLRPVVDKIDLVTDISVIGDSLFICTQPGLLLRKSLASPSTTDFSIFL